MEKNEHEAEYALEMELTDEIIENRANQREDYREGQGEEIFEELNRPSGGEIKEMADVRLNEYTYDMCKEAAKSDEDARRVFNSSRRSLR